MSSWIERIQEMSPGIFPCDFKNKYFQNFNFGDVSEIFLPEMSPNFSGASLGNFFEEMFKI